MILNGKYQGPTHQDCNLNLTLNKKLYIVLHILQIYDSHLVFQEGNKHNFEIRTTPKTIEKYVRFTAKQSKKSNINPGFSLVFIDSPHFLN